MDECECCHGLRGHRRLKDVMCEEFEDEYLSATKEVERLTGLMKEVNWYNFETQCRNWKYPWPLSFPDSQVELNGISIEVDTRHGRAREIGHFPIWYSGTVRDAPPLPPEILLKELKDAAKYRTFCQQQATAPHDWAPGGDLYKKLLAETTVPTDAARRRDIAYSAAARISKRLKSDDA